MNTPHDPYENLTFVDALIQQNPDWEPEEVVLVIGDGVAVFDEEFPLTNASIFTLTTLSSTRQQKPHCWKTLASSCYVSWRKRRARNDRTKR
jgi:hypothetical protein